MKKELHKQLIKGIKNTRKKLTSLHRNERIHSQIISKLKHYLYSHTLLLFFINMNKKNMDELKITKEGVEETRERFRDLIKKAESDKDYITSEEYHSFRKFILNLRRKQAKLLREIEGGIAFEKCEADIINFEKEIKKMGINIERLMEYKDRSMRK